LLTQLCGCLPLALLLLLGYRPLGLSSGLLPRPFSLLLSLQSSLLSSFLGSALLLGLVRHLGFEPAHLRRMAFVSAPLFQLRLLMGGIHLRQQGLTLGHHVLPTGTQESGRHGPHGEQD
jgi:hypothetical protein